MKSHWRIYSGSKMRSRVVAFLISLLLLMGGIQAQDGDIDLEAFVEKLFQFQDEDLEYDDLYESLLLLYTNPLNLNKASQEDLESTYILTPFQARDIVEYIQQNGKLISIYELQSIASLNTEIIQNLVPFVTVEDAVDSRPLLQRVITEPNKFFLFRVRRNLEEERGFRDGDFIGDQNQVYGRFRVSHKGDYSLGFTVEKDIGEQLTFGNNTGGFDFVSFHAMLENLGMLDKVIVGDFQAQYGQGVVFGSGFSPGKGSETITTTRRSTTGIRPYTSALENGFFRGVAASRKFGNLEASAFYSNLKQDANILTDTTFTEFDEFVNSIQQTGLHRTESELNARNQITEQSIGGALQYNFNRNLNVGFTGLFSKFSTPIQRRPTNINQFEFQGDDNFVGGFYGNLNWQNFTFFGEAARSSSGGIGAVGGLIASLTPQLDLSFVYRNYDRDFHSFFGNAFSESSRNINEIGTYWGLKFRPSKKHEIAVYYDKFRFPWLRFRTEAPSDGFEYLGRWTYHITKSISLFAHFRQENRQRSFQPDGSNLNILEDTRRRNYIVNLDYKLNRFLSLKSRVQFSDFKLAGELTRGFAILQDVNFSFWKLKLSGRIALIDTDNGENRQFFYERNALYAFSNRGISGVASRRYLLLQFKLNRKITFWGRIAQTSFQDTESILFGGVSSGVNEIEGNKITEVTLQTQIKF